MKKWGFLIAPATLGILAAGLAGCGGGGSNAAGGGGGGGNRTGDSVIQVTLPVVLQNGLASGNVNFNYLSGQGRGTGDLIADISKEFLQLNLSDPSTIVQEGTGGVDFGHLIHLNLNGYNFQTIPLAVPVANSVGSATYPYFYLIVDAVKTDNGDGTFLTYQPPAPSIQPIPARITVFRGRQTAVQCYLHDGIIDLGADGSTPTFHLDLFQAANFDKISMKMNSFISDYVQFDISHLASQPTMVDGSKAQNFYVSGDGFAITGAAAKGTFEVLTLDPNNPQLGVYNPPVPGFTSFSTYNLFQTDPRDLNNKITITSQLGIFREYHSLFSGIGSFEFITFPNSNDDNNQSLVILVRNGDTITNMYFGNADLKAQTFNAFPVDQVVSAGTVGQITGTLNTLIDATGSATTTPMNVREGRFAFNVPAGGLPVGFKPTGRFVSFRN